MRSGKGQVETGELIMVVIVVVVLLILGLVGYSMFQTSGIEQSMREAESLSTVELAQEAASMNEISCAYSREVQAECLDLYRVSSFSEQMGSQPPNSNVSNHYRSKFGTALITVEQVYPEEEEWVIYNQTRENATEIPVRLPVFIFDPLAKTNGFGVLTVVRFT